jgi:hypothetical protein
MFQPYLAILRRLFTFQKCRTVLVLKSKYFSAIAFLSFVLKYIYVRTQPFILSLTVFLLQRLCFCIVIFSPVNIGVVLLSLLRYAPLVCMFPVVECMLLNKMTQKTRTLQEENSAGKDKQLCSHINVF